MFSKNEINTGRQYEFDYMKGIFTPMILLIHAFQMLGGSRALVPAYQIFYTIATMTGSAIFIFVLGLGTTYSRRSNKQLAQNGGKLLVHELLWNALALCLPMILGQLVRGLFGLATAWDFTWANASIMIGYINVFFNAGIAYLLLALLRKIRIPTWSYFALAVIFIFLNPLLYMNGKTTGSAALDFVLTTFVGGRPAISLCCLSHIPYALLGVGFGRVLRKTTDKGRLYKMIAVPAVLIVAAYFVYAIRINDGLDSFYTFIDTQYTYPGTLRALANCSSIMLMAGALYALCGWIGKTKPLHNALMHFNKQTTPYYAVHPFFYGLIFSLAGFMEFPAMACVGLSLVVWALCFGTITVWNRLRTRGN